MSDLPPAAGGVLVQGRRALLLHLRERDEWRLPKGHLRTGETPAEAALREVAEETGFSELALGPVVFDEVVEYRTGAGWVARRQTYHLLRLTGYARQPRSARDARRFAVHWLEAAEALERISFAAERQALQAALRAAE